MKNIDNAQDTSLMWERKAPY